MERNISDRLYIIELYDIYGQLLTKKQQEILEAYYFDDYSLSEISLENNVSRQAIHNNILRATESLLTFEDKIGMFSYSKKMINKINMLFRLFDDNSQINRHDVERIFREEADNGI